MKILESKKHSPLYISPGDVLHMDVVWAEDGVDVKRETLASYTFEEPRTVDTTILFDLDPEEATKLGLEHGIGGLIGKEA